jgi:hypothetical protein
MRYGEMKSKCTCLHLQAYDHMTTMDDNLEDKWCTCLRRQTTNDAHFWDNKHQMNYDAHVWDTSISELQGLNISDRFTDFPSS